MKNFEYKKVSTLDEAFSLLGQGQDGAMILAGGTDILVKIRNRVWHPGILIDIKGIPGLDEIRYDAVEGLYLGPLTSIHRLETSPIIREMFPAIFEAASSLGSFQVRCRATLGGNLCSASPAGDMAPSLIGLGAKAKIVGRGQERWVPLEDFFTAPNKTLLKRDELLAAVQVPNIPPGTGSKYIKFAFRKAMDLAIVGVAVALSLDSKREQCEEIRIALGAVGPTPLRAKKAETRLRGQRMDEAAIAEASLLASEEVTPISDIRASGEYRREMVRVLTQKTLNQLLCAGFDTRQKV